MSPAICFLYDIATGVVPASSGRVGGTTQNRGADLLGVGLAKRKRWGCDGCLQELSHGGMAAIEGLVSIKVRVRAPRC